MRTCFHLLRFVLALLAICAFSNAFAADKNDVAKPASIWEDPDRGFYWYPRVPEEEDQQPPAQPKIFEMRRMEDIKKELNRLRDEAIVKRTPEAVLEFLRAQNFVYDMSAQFADVAQRTAWANPDVDYNNRNPVANFAQQAKYQRADRTRNATIQALSADSYGIIFFARSDCGYCHDQAPVLKAFQRNTGMEVMAISMDGGPIPNFPDAKPDNGISMMASNGQGVTTVPALYLVDKDKKQMIPLGTGVLAGDEIMERIRILTTTEPGAEF